MTRKKYIGSFVRILLPDDSYGYGRLRERNFASFYDVRTKNPVSNLEEIEIASILFTVIVHNSVFAKWEVIGKKPLEEHMKQPVWLFWQDIDDYRNCLIYDIEGNEKAVTPEQCEKFEPEAFWEALHVEERLLDTFMGRTNPYVESMKVRYENYI